jgi:CheY-like chemotaxis protein
MTSDGSPDHPRPPETILFVEDDALVRMDMAEYLRECGYRVHGAADATEAMVALRAKFAIDLVFTDINLGQGMNGVELARWILENRPGVKVIVTTGEASIPDLPTAAGALLPKPYTGRDLVARIKEALQDAPPDTH